MFDVSGDSYPVYQLVKYRKPRLKRHNRVPIEHWSRIEIWKDYRMYRNKGKKL